MVADHASHLTHNRCHVDVSLFLDKACDTCGSIIFGLSVQLRFYVEFIMEILF